jgi:hypothetical protein
MSHSVSECVDVAPLKGYHYLNEADLPGCNIACVYGGMMWADHALDAGIWPVNGSYEVPCRRTYDVLGLLLL